MKTTQEPTKKQAIMDAGIQLMLDKGYVATTVDEICAAAGVTKGSFFYYFKNKEDLGKALINCFGIRQQAIIDQQLKGINDPRERVFAYLDFIIKVSKDCCNKGCLVGTLVQELYESHPEIKEQCSSNFHKHAAFLKKELTAAKQQYAAEADVDVNGLAESFMALTQGALILIKAHGDRSIMERTLNHYKSYLQSIFG